MMGRRILAQCATAVLLVLGPLRGAYIVRDQHYITNTERLGGYTFGL